MGNLATQSKTRVLLPVQWGQDSAQTNVPDMSTSQDMNQNHVLKCDVGNIVLFP